MNLVNTSSRVRKADVGLESAALFDVLLIAVLLLLTGSKFILAPGIGIEVGGDALPTSAVLEKSLTSDSASCVLTAAGNSMLIFDGRIMTVKDFARSLAQTRGSQHRSTLLLKTSKNIDAQTLLDIFQAAKDGGFTKVQIAAKPSDSQ